MRASYLRQIAQPVAAGAPVLRPSRRWPLRAGEERVPASPSTTMPPQPELFEAKADAEFIQAATDVGGFQGRVDSQRFEHIGGA